MKKKRKFGRKLFSFLLTLAMVVGLMPGMGMTAYAADVPYANLKNTINVINFDGKKWYLIDYDDSTVTLLSKECVGASVFNPNNPDDNTYIGSTVENFVNSWYTGKISPDAQAVVSGSGMFLLTEEQAGNLSTDVLKCYKASGAHDNHWWLCSKGTTSSSAAMVNGESGNVSGYSGNVWIAYGVRPALKLDLSKVMFDSDTNTFMVKIKVDVTGVTLNKTAVTLNVNGTETLTATVAPDNATDRTITWSSGNTAVATVSDGVVTAVAEGTANITVTATNGTDDTSDDKTATCEVTVKKPESTVTKDPTAKTSDTPSSDDTKETVLNDYLNHLYESVLKRELDETGKKDWSQMLKDGRGSMADVVYSVVNSPEYASKEVSDEDYIDSLYQAILNRAPDAGEKQDWIEFLKNGGSREQVLAGFVNSDEFSALCDSIGYPRGTLEIGTDGKARSSFKQEINNFVMRNYKYALERTGEAKGVEYWCDKLTKKTMTPEDVAKSFFLSEEFTNKKLSDEDFVERLYLTFLDRASDPKGKAYWLDKLKNGTSREDIIPGFAYSKEFKNIIESFGL